MRFSLAATLLLSAAPTALHAASSDKDDKIRRLEVMMSQMQAQIKSLKAAVGEEKVEGRRTREKVRQVAEKSYAVPASAGPALPVGAVPAFVTANKQLQFGALTITPGGFFAADSVFRSRTVQADISTPWNNIPFGPQAGTNEFRFTSRATRIAGLIEAPITPNLLISGYGEFDFQGSGVNSNENQSDSFVPRIRNLYGALDFTDYGFHVLAGQNWSLATLNSKGITPRNEVTPPTIDTGYLPGFVYKRQPQIRITKDFGGKLWLSLSAEEPQNTISGCTAGQNGTTIAAGYSGTNNAVTCQLPGVGILNGTVPTTTTISGVTGATATSTTSITNFSLDHVPDVIGKAAYEARLGERDIHFEGFGMYRDLYDRVAYATPTAAFSPMATNHDRTGYGVGGGVIVPVLPRRLDFQASGLWGKGIGSYGASQFSDATFGSDGALSAIPESMLLGGLVAHATPAIDIYAFSGVEQVQPHYFATSAPGAATFTGYGYGVPTANNTGCFNTITNGTCAGNSKRVWQITGGFWDKLYRGSFGELRVGVQYSYTQRELFAGSGYASPALGPYVGSPHQNENIVETSLRYYPFN